MNKKNVAYTKMYKLTQHGMRKCVCCGEKKYLTDFYNDKYDKQGKKRRCKLCSYTPVNGTNSRAYSPRGSQPQIIEKETIIVNQKVPNALVYAAICLAIIAIITALAT